MPRLLPCDNCRDHALLRDGTPYLVGSVHVFPYQYPCRRCKLTTTITAVRFNQLPDVTADQLADFGLLESYARDLTLGHQLPIGHAVDLYRAGFDVETLEALTRQE